MSKFIVRVVLHGAKESDYTELHTFMRSREFKRTIKGDSGKSWHLPSATYFRETPLNALKVRESAASAARETGMKYAVFVAEAGETAWEGLEEVRPISAQMLRSLMAQPAEPRPPITLGALLMQR